LYVVPRYNSIDPRSRFRSVHAVETEPLVAPYAAAKAALLSLTREAMNLARRWRDDVLMIAQTSYALRAISRPKFLAILSWHSQG
jgi:NAD(P)-dependent dehydrogenase (short-subunit alcohol dehydrogenase family)